MKTVTESEFQKLCGDFVAREVNCNASSLISELASIDKYTDDLLSVCVTYPEGIEEDDPIEALEHWLVSDWLADKLIEQGEMVIKDFLGLTIWGRTNSGQAIIMDYVIRQIVSQVMEVEVQS